MPAERHKVSVSLIMPTRGRSHLASLALVHAMNQDYDPARTEIVVFDDDDNPSFPVPFSDPPPTPTKPLIRYFRNPQSLFRTLGDKRNAMCEEAHGDIIAHVDSDDLSAPNRIFTQVHTLLLSGADISGFHTLPFYDIASGLAYVYHLNSACVCGTSLVYRRNFWRTHPFPPADIGEDLPYTSGNRERRLSSDGRRMIVALLHDGNMSSRTQVSNHPAIFPQIPADSLPGWFQTARRENNWQPVDGCGSVAERYQQAVP